MSKNIGFYYVANATETAEKARNLMRIVPNGTANETDLINAIQRSLSVSETRIRLIWDEILKVAGDALREGNKVDLNWMRLEMHIPSSMDFEDSSVDEETNAIEICGYLANDYAERINAELTPKLLSNAEVAALVQLSNLMDLETSAFNEIHLEKDVLVLGNGITLDGDDEYARLIHKATGHIFGKAEVVRVSRGQRAVIVFKREATPFAGKYTFELGTHGLAGDGKLHVKTKPVSVFLAPPVEMTEGVKVKVKVGGEGEDTVGIYGGALAEGSAKAKIDWGDGYVEEVTSLSQLSHKYELPGEYTLRISDDVSEIAFSSPIASSPFTSEYAKRILEVEGVGEKLKTLRASALSNAANLVNAKFASVDNVLTDVLKGANAIHYIHFAAANETALKASAGYQADARLGSTSARVKFDL